MWFRCPIADICSPATHCSRAWSRSRSKKSRHLRDAYSNPVVGPSSRRTSSMCCISKSPVKTNDVDDQHDIHGEEAKSWAPREGEYRSHVHSHSIKRMPMPLLPLSQPSTARMRDAIREEQITRKGWKLHRIWSTDWYQNRTSAIERLHRAVEDARSIHLARTSRTSADGTD